MSEQRRITEIHEQHVPGGSPFKGNVLSFVSNIASPEGSRHFVSVNDCSKFDEVGEAETVSFYVDGELALQLAEHFSQIAGDYGLRPSAFYEGHEMGYRLGRDGEEAAHLRTREETAAKLHRLALDLW